MKPQSGSSVKPKTRESPGAAYDKKYDARQARVRVTPQRGRASRFVEWLHSLQVFAASNRRETLARCSTPLLYYPARRTQAHRGEKTPDKTFQMRAYRVLCASLPGVGRQNGRPI
jgi:hypothetical protein